MGKKTNWLIYFSIAAILITTISGCASSRNKMAFRSEEVLVRSGFQVRPADTPEKLAHIKALPQDKLVKHEYKGKLYYVFANAAAEGIYIGNQKDYDNFIYNLKENKWDALKDSTWVQNADEIIWRGSCEGWCNWDMWYGDWYLY